MSRTAVATVHLLAVMFLAVMLFVPISPPGYTLLTALVVLADQGITWPIWLAGGRRGPNPVRGWW